MGYLDLNWFGKLKNIMKMIKFFKKLFSIQQHSKVLEKYIKLGIVKIGNNCEISQDSIFIVHEDKAKVEIGNNVCLRGRIIVYTNGGIVKIGSNVYIGPNSLIECSKEIEIRNNVLISSNCNITDNDSHSISTIVRRKDCREWSLSLLDKDWNGIRMDNILIEDDCWIGLRSIILKGVKLGIGTIVGAGSVVTKSTNSFETIAGNPAKQIGTSKI